MEVAMEPPPLAAAPPDVGGGKPRAGVPASAEPKETADEIARRRVAETDVLRRAAALKEAKVRAEQAAASSPYDPARPRTHWDFVLAEMAWMAADFAGERLWKLAVACKLSGAAAAAEGRPEKRALELGDAEQLAARRAAAGVVAFWTRMKTRAVAGAAAVPDGEAAPPLPALRSLESWALQTVRHRVAAAAAAPLRAGEDDALPFARLSLCEAEALARPDSPPPSLWPLLSLCYVDCSDFEAGLGGPALLDAALAAEARALAAHEDRVRDWQQGERARLRSVGDAQRAAKEEEEARATLTKQHAAASALASASAALAAYGGGGGGAHGGGGGGGGGDWEDRRRRKGKKGGLGFGYEEGEFGPVFPLPSLHAGAGIPGKRSRTTPAAASAARAAALLGDPYGLGAAAGLPGRYPGYSLLGGGGYTMPHDLPQPKRRKGEEGEDGLPRPRGRERERAGKKARGGAAQQLPPPPVAVVPWSEAEEALLGAIVREFCRPRSNWALTSDVLAQGAPFRGVFRRPDMCRAQWEQATALQGGAGAGEGEEEDAARGRRRQLLSSLLPVEQELLKLHLERLCLVGQRHRAVRAADSAAEAASRRGLPHPSWAAALAAVGEPLGPEVLAEEEPAEPAPAAAAAGAQPAEAALETPAPPPERVAPPEAALMEVDPPVQPAAEQEAPEDGNPTPASARALVPPRSHHARSRSRR